MQESFCLSTYYPILNSVWQKISANKNLSLLNLKQKEIQSLAQSLLKLQRGLTGDRSLIAEPYMDSSLFASYLLYYWPSSYMQVKNALLQVSKFYTLNTDLSVLDLGSGPGSAAFAALDFGYKSAYLIDSSSQALSAAKEIATLSKKNITTHEQSLYETLSNTKGQKYSLITLSHSLNELWKDDDLRLEKRSALLLDLSEILHDDGIILTLEPSLLKTSRELIQVRNKSLEKGLFCLGPCFYKGMCPCISLSENQTCHMEYSWELPSFTKAIADEAGLERPVLKTTWFAFSKNELTKNKSAEFNQEKLELVVSEPMLNKGGRTRYFICGASGRRTISAKLEILRKNALLFKDLKRTDIIEIENPEQRETGLGVSENTHIRSL